MYSFPYIILFMISLSHLFIHFQKLLHKCIIEFFLDWISMFLRKPYKNTSQSLPDSECNKSCDGNIEETCGASWRIEVYTYLYL